MGRALAAGIMTRFDITKKNNWNNEHFDLEKNLKRILKDISNIIDPSMYEVVMHDNESYEFALKPEIFNKNIHELIKEIGPLTCPNISCFYDIGCELTEKNTDICSKKMIEKYPFAIKVSEDGTYFVELNEEENEWEEGLFDPLYWIIKDDELSENVEISASVILLWMDESKYVGEDETNMLKIMNNMKSKYYSSPLSKALIYYISD